MAGPTATFQRSWPARPESVRDIRSAVAAFADEHGMAPERIRDVHLAVSEAATNAVVHAYPDAADGELSIRACVEDGQLVVFVRDWGHGMTPRIDSPGMGLGLPVIAQLAQSFTVTAAPDAAGGTEVCMCFALP